MSKITLTDAFKQYLFQLALDEFPSGNGNWRNELRYHSDQLAHDDKYLDAELFSTESLLELQSLQPFVKDTTWSENVKNILDDSVKTPGKLNENNVLRKFEKLRIIGKEVEVIDESTRPFTKLQELILSANLISDINGENLPKSLKVLELCANKINDLKTFVLKMPSLHYLGLSYNSIISIHEHITPCVWTGLLCLDLSFNFIDDLEHTIEALQKLKTLKSLLLKGNPVYCFMGYRGILIDSLSRLKMLDDIHVTADDRLYHKGICNLQDLSCNEFVLHLHLSKLKGMLPQDQQTSLTDDYPLKIVQYEIQIAFPLKFVEKDKESFLKGGNRYGALLDDCDDVVILMDSEDSSSTVTSSSTSSYVIKAGEFTVNSDDEIPMDYETYVIGKHVRKLHEYLRHPINIEIIVHHIVVSNEPKLDEDKSKGLGNELQPGGVAKDKSTKSMDRSKSKLSVGKVAKDESSSKPTKAKGRASKQEPAQLYEWSRTQKVYATCQVNCDSVLEDSKTIHKECVFDVDVEIAKEISCSSASDSTTKRLQDQKKKMSRDMKRGGGSAKSLLANKNKKTNDDSNVNKDLSGAGEEQSDVLLPVTVDFQLELVKWDCIQEASDYLFGVTEESES